MTQLIALVNLETLSNSPFSPYHITHSSSNSIPSFKDSYLHASFGKDFRTSQAGNSSADDTDMGRPALRKDATYHCLGDTVQMCKAHARMLERLDLLEDFQGVHSVFSERVRPALHNCGFCSAQSSNMRRRQKHSNAMKRVQRD